MTFPYITRDKIAAISLAMIGVIGAQTLTRADVLFENFDGAEWPIGFHSETNVNGYVLHNGLILSVFTPVFSAPKVCWLGNGNSPSYLQTPYLTNGIGTLSFQGNNRNRQINTNFVETSLDATNWTTVSSLVITNDQTASGDPDWAPYQAVLNFHGPGYVRIRGGATIGGQFIGIEDVAATDPPAAAFLENLTIAPETPLHNDPVDIEIDASISTLASNLALTNFYRIGIAGPFMPIPMITNGSPTHFVTQTPIPGQPVGSLVQYYVQATFTGPNALSPTNSPAGGSNAPSAYAVAERPFNTGFKSMAVIDDVTLTMNLVNDFTWQGLHTTNNQSGAQFRIRGVVTNDVATNTWGDADQAISNFVVSGFAGQDENAISIADTIAAQAVFEFVETNLEYEVREAVYQDFLTWPDQLTFDTTTHQGWKATDARILTPADPNLKLRGKATILNSNGTANIRSPQLPEGVGHVEFWYRHGEDGAPPTAFYIQRSETGSDSAADWQTIGSVSNITVTNYLRYSLQFNNRHSSYVRILNSTNPASMGMLALDEIIAFHPGAGVKVSNLVIAPPAPTAINAVTVSVDVVPEFGASNLAVTLYHTDTSGEYQPIAMNPASGNTYVSSSPIPAAQGTGPSGTGPVEYFIEITFDGFEAALASPTVFPDGGSNAPAAFTNANASIALSNPVIRPDPPTTKTNITFEIDVAFAGGASAAAGLLRYRIGDSGPFSSLSLTGGSPLVSAGAIPTITKPGTRVEYYYEVSFSGPNAQSPTNFPAAGAAAPIVTIVRKQIDSTYTNLSVAGSYNQDLLLVDDYWWLGVETTSSNITDGTFHFDAGIDTYGDAAPASTIPPVHGTAELSGPDVQISGTQSGHFAFVFHETNLAYEAQSAEYENFNVWQFSTYGNRTNPDGWSMFDARTTTAGDGGREFQDGGDSLVLPDGGTGNVSYLQSPFLSSGIGAVHLLFRAWETNGVEDEASLFHLQKSTNGVDGWITIATVSNILSVDYCHFTTNVSDLNFHSIRILNDTNASHERILIDEVVITEPGSGVVFSNVVQTPLNPAISNTVDVSVDIYPLTGTSNITADVLFRVGSSGSFDRVMLSDAGNTYSGTLPRATPGTVQYYFEANYDGFGAAPAFHPPFGANDPFVYTVSPSTNVFEDFGTWPNGLHTPLMINGWTLSNGIVTPAGDPIGDRKIWFRTDESNTFLQLPYLAHGIGALRFYGISVGTDVPDLDIEIQTSSNGTDWLTHTTHFIPTNWTEQLTIMNIEEPTYVRLFQPNNATTGWRVQIDNMFATYPASRVEFALNITHPGYPSSSETVRVSCFITNISSFIPAVNISGDIYYRVRPRFGSFPSMWEGPLPMQRVGDYFISSTPVPRTNTALDVQYYVQASFNGYSGLPQNNHNPSFFPAGVVVTSSTFYVNPPNGFQYTVRRFKSDYGSENVILNGDTITMSLLRDKYWQGVATLNSQPLVYMQFSGANRYTNGAHAYLPGPFMVGDNGHWRTRFPLWSTGGLGESNILVNAGTNGNFDGQFLFRFDEDTHEYTVQKCLYQSFETFQVSPQYIRSFDDGLFPFEPKFDQDYTNDPVFNSSENFSSDDWTSTYAATGAFANTPWGIYNAKVDSSDRVETDPDSFGASLRYVVFVRLDSASDPFSGVGTVSFNYFQQSGQSTNDHPLTLEVYTSNSNLDYKAFANWDLPPLLIISNIDNASSLPASVDINTGFSKDVIIFQDAANTQSLVLDNVKLTSWYADTKETDDWIAAESWITSEFDYRFDTGLSASPGLSCEFDVTREDSHTSSNQYLRGPQLTNGIGWVTFQFLRADGNPVSYKIEWAHASDPSNWMDIPAANGGPISATYSGATGVWQFASYNIDLVSNSFVRILHTSGNTGRFVVDEVQFGQIAVGNTWEADNIKVAESDPDPLLIFRGRTGYLNDGNADVGTPAPTEPPDPLLVSPPLDRPLGEISFWYKEHNDGGDPAKLTLELSPDRVAWTPFASFNAQTAGEFEYYSTSFYETAYSYFRIRNGVAGSDRVAIDDLIVGEPLASEILSSNLWLDPVAPLNVDEVDVYAVLYDHFGDPSNINVTLHFFPFTNQWNAWSEGQGQSRTMSVYATNPATRSVVYKTDSGIPPKPVDAVVQYFVKYTWKGRLSDAVSPHFERIFSNPDWYDPIDLNLEFGAPSNAMPYYIVFSSPPGSVWVNEIDPVGFFGSHVNDFVELAGWGGSDINNWTLEVWDSTPANTATYLITNNAVIATETNSHGFWVIAKSSIADPPRDQLLTSDLEYPGGIRLKRTYGTIESAVCFADSEFAVSMLTNLNFVYIGKDDDISGQSVSATGTGHYFTNFPPLWNNLNGYSVGAVNNGQTFTTPPFNNPVLIIISPYGTTDPAVGSSWYFSGTTLTGSVLNAPVIFGGATQHTVLGWSGTGSVPVSGVSTSTGPFTITNDSILTWHWDTNYFLSLSTTGDGSVDQTNSWLALESNVTLNATADSNTTFLSWSGGGVPGGSESNNPLFVTMDQARMIVANFSALIPALGSNDVRIINIQVDSNVWLTATGTNMWFPTPYLSTNLMNTNSWAIVPTFQFEFTNGHFLIWFPFDPSHIKAYYQITVTNSQGQ